MERSVVSMETSAKLQLAAAACVGAGGTAAVCPLRQSDGEETSSSVVELDSRRSSLGFLK